MRGHETVQTIENRIIALYIYVVKKKEKTLAADSPGSRLSIQCRPPDRQVDPKVPDCSGWATTRESAILVNTTPLHRVYILAGGHVLGRRPFAPNPKLELLLGCHYCRRIKGQLSEALRSCSISMSLPEKQAVTAGDASIEKFARYASRRCIICPREAPFTNADSQRTSDNSALSNRTARHGFAGNDLLESRLRRPLVSNPHYWTNSDATNTTRRAPFHRIRNSSRRCDWNVRWIDCSLRSSSRSLGRHQYNGYHCDRGPGRNHCRFDRHGTGRLSGR